MNVIKQGGLFFILLCVVSVLSGCEDNAYNQQASAFTLYQVSDDGMGLKQSKYNTVVDGDDTVEVVTELLDNYKLVDVKEFEIKEKQLSIFFSSAYHNLDSIDEVLLRAAIVKTLCQVNGVEYVEFFVEDASLVIDGTPVGVMSELSFLDSVGGNGYTRNKYATLFFSDLSGTGMKEVTVPLTYDMTVPFARLLVEQLLSGPEEIEGVNTSDVRQTIPEGTSVNSLTLRDNVCYIDFSKQFLDVQAEVKSEIVIYSIVNTICELSEVNRVQFTVDGEQRARYGDLEGFDVPFERNLDLVSGGSKG